MQQRNGTQIYYILLQAITYLIAGVFLLTFKETELPANTLQIIGVIFLGLGFALVLATFCSFLMRWVSRLDKIFLLGLFLATLAILIKTLVDAAGSMTLFYSILAFIILIPVALINDYLRDMREQQREVGTRTILIKSLKAVAVATSMFAGLLTIFKVSGMGNPILYLSVGLLSLAIASMLEHHNMVPGMGGNAHNE